MTISSFTNTLWTNHVKFHMNQSLDRTKWKQREALHLYSYQDYYNMIWMALWVPSSFNIFLALFIGWSFLHKHFQKHHRTTMSYRTWTPSRRTFSSGLSMWIIHYKVTKPLNKALYRHFRGRTQLFKLSFSQWSTSCLTRMQHNYWF